MKLLRSLLVLFALISFAGAADAKKINWEGMRQVKVGMTTAEVVKLVGKPISISAVNGKLYYGWASAGIFGIGGVSVVTIEFTDGKVTVAPTVPEEVK
jgi:hypothetical protein